MNTREKYKNFTIEELIVLKLALHNYICTSDDEMQEISMHLIDEVINEINKR